jgi:nucleotide-binding universal stress UspA family protein
MKSILALAGGTARLEATLDTALLAARRLDARLCVLHVRAEPEQLAYYAGDMVVPVPMAGQSIEDAEEIIAERETRARAVFDKMLGGDPRRATWRAENGRESEVVASLGRAADLVVIARAGDTDEDIAPESVSAALFETGRPVLVAPPVPPPAIGTRVAIAWNDSLQSARAVGAAMRFIALASEVRVLIAGHGGERAATDALVDYLGCWGVKPVVEPFDPGSNSGRARGRGLLQHAQGMNADLLVMGAYGQGRMMQFLGLGGATAKVITGNTMPLLLTH